MGDRIAEITTFICQMPKRREWTQHGMAETLRDRVLLRLRTGDGLNGWGEATALAQWGGMQGRYYGETTSTVCHIVHDLFSTSILGSDPRSPRLVMEKLDASIIGHPYAKATVEMALQDLRGKLCGEPLYRLLGGSYRNGIRIGHMLGMMEVKEAVEEAQQCIEADGITAFQIKGGTDPGRDVALVSRLRRSLPDHIFLRLDANKGYGKMPKELANNVKALEGAGINAIEQPASTVDGLRVCREAVSVPIIADEGCWTPRDVLELWEAGAVDAVSVYVAKAGGMAEAAEVARLAALVGFRCDVNGSLETGIGDAASLHVALAAETLNLPSIIPIPSTREKRLTQFAGRYWEDDVVTSGYSYKAGFLHIGDEPGLGITVDEEKVSLYTAGEPRVSRSSGPI